MKIVLILYLQFLHIIVSCCISFKIIRRFTKVLENYQFPVSCSISFFLFNFNFKTLMTPLKRAFQRQSLFSHCYFFASKHLTSQDNKTSRTRSNCVCGWEQLTFNKQTNKQTKCEILCFCV